jgi:serine-type D-Ala-D-Ala carboxypeptidase (penicillin-binding protein 5/6)
MNRSFLLTACALALLATRTAHAQTTPAPKAATATPTAAAAPASPALALAPPSIAATSHLLVDLSTGQTLAANGETVQREPASLTKLMTAYVVFQALKQKQIQLGQTVPVSVKAWKAEGSRMFIEPLKPVTVEELLRGMIIQSGNDASVALAEAVAGSEDAFSQRMNAEAKRLGMTQSSFANSAGLPAPNHLTTAKDMSLLASALIRDFPDYYAYYKEKSYTYNKITQENRNKLLFSDPTVDGVKTGHTQSAGYNLIASSMRDGRRLLTVVMGTGSESARAVESKKLLDFGFGAFDSVVIKAKNAAVTEQPVWKAKADTIALGVADDWRINVPRGGTAPTVEWTLSTQPLAAPLAAGTKVGMAQAKLNGQTLSERPLIVLQTAEEGSFFRRMWHSLKMQWSKK